MGTDRSACAFPRDHAREGDSVHGNSVYLPLVDVLFCASSVFLLLILRFQIETTSASRVPLADFDVYCEQGVEGSDMLRIENAAGSVTTVADVLAAITARIDPPAFTVLVNLHASHDEIACVRDVQDRMSEANALYSTNDDADREQPWYILEWVISGPDDQPGRPAPP